MNVVPFNSEIYCMEMSGHDLLHLLEQSASMVSGVLQQSGLTLEIDPSREIGQRVVSAIIGSEALDLEKTYTIAANAFIVAGGDGFTGFLKGINLRSTSVIEREMVVDYIKKKVHVAPGLNGRIIISEKSVNYA
ncbi:Trifunctional nucleotide phosphoesterase protein YfkN precursor [compost metagenome]